MTKITETRKTDCINVNKPSGAAVSVTKRGIEINTGRGCLLITKVKPESKGVMNAYDFANGAKILKSSKLGE